MRSRWWCALFHAFDSSHTKVIADRRRKTGLGRGCLGRKPRRIFQNLLNSRRSLAVYLARRHLAAILRRRICLQSRVHLPAVCARPPAARDFIGSRAGASPEVWRFRRPSGGCNNRLVVNRILSVCSHFCCRLATEYCMFTI
jgi:hypothetical protein